jgi:hypothetical protein
MHRGRRCRRLTRTGSTATGEWDRRDLVCGRERAWTRRSTLQPFHHPNKQKRSLGAPGREAGATEKAVQMNKRPPGGAAFDCWKGMSLLEGLC